MTQQHKVKTIYTCHQQAVVLQLPGHPHATKLQGKACGIQYIHACTVYVAGLALYSFGTRDALATVTALQATLQMLTNPRRGSKTARHAVVFDPGAIIGGGDRYRCVTCGVLR